MVWTWLDGLGRKENQVKNKELQGNLEMGMNLQFFAEGDDAGADNGNDSGTGEEGDAGTQDDTAGEDDKHQSFDDFLKDPKNQAEFDW